MTITIKLTVTPFVDVAHIKNNNQYIKLEPKRRSLKFAVLGEGRKRIVLDVCNFMVKTFNENPTRFMETSKLEPMLKSWFYKVCYHEYKNYKSETHTEFETSCIQEGRRLVLEALGFAQTEPLPVPETLHESTQEELVSEIAAIDPEQLANETSISLPIGNGRSVTLSFPKDLNPDEANLITDGSLDYFKHLLKTNYKK
ncbi:hypothetical protein [Pseudomonas putida]|uniref:hypothetical protein n=1 Tax=Pseudomonas putida TaxID=303 RepID=UPI0037C8B10B